MWKTILLAYDGSEYANQALVNAYNIAKNTNASLKVLAVIKLPEPMLGLKPEEFIDDATKYYMQHFTEAKDKIPESDLNLKLDILVGRPSESILNYAMQIKADLIVVGYTKKKLLLDKLILGSVAKQILDHAGCSVLLVR